MNSMQHKVSFKRRLIDLNFKFAFSLTSCHTKIKVPSLLCYLPITEMRIVGFIPFPRVLIPCKM